MPCARALPLPPASPLACAPPPALLSVGYKTCSRGPTHIYVGRWVHDRSSEARSTMAGLCVGDASASRQLAAPGLVFVHSMESQGDRGARNAGSGGSQTVCSFMIKRACATSAPSDEHTCSFVGPVAATPHTSHTPFRELQEDATG